MHLYINSLITKEVNSIHSKSLHVGRLTKIRDVVISTQYHPNQLVKHEPSIRHAVSQLRGSGEMAIKKILDIQFEIILKSEDIKKTLLKYETQEWQMLRGYYPGMYLKTQDFKHKTLRDFLKKNNLAI